MSRLSSLARSMPRQFWFIWFGTIVNRIGSLVGLFLAVFLAGERGFSSRQTAVLLLLWGAGSVLGRLAGGVAADALGRARTLSASMLLTAVSYVALLPSWDLLVTGLLLFTAGAATDAYRPAVNALVADLVPREDRLQAYALLYWAINVGVGVGAVSGGFIARAGFEPLLVVDSVTSLAFAALVWGGVPRESRRSSSSPQTTAGKDRALRDKDLILMTCATALYALVFMQGTSTFALVVTRDTGTSTVYGLVAAVNPLTVIAIQPALFRVMSRLTPRSLTSLGSVVTGGGFAAVAFVNGPWGFGACVFVWSLGEIAFNAGAPTVVGNLSPSHALGRYQGIWGSAWSVGLLTGPAAGVLVLGLAGPRTLWLGCLALCLVAAWMCSLVRNADPG